jgi:hypothetical protein
MLSTSVLFLLFCFSFPSLHIYISPLYLYILVSQTWNQPDFQLISFSLICLSLSTLMIALPSVCPSLIVIIIDLIPPETCGLVSVLLTHQTQIPQVRPWFPSRPSSDLGTKSLLPSQPPTGTISNKLDRSQAIFYLVVVVSKLSVRSMIEISISQISLHWARTWSYFKASKMSWQLRHGEVEGTSQEW